MRGAVQLSEENQESVGAEPGLHCAWDEHRDPRKAMGYLIPLCLLWALRRCLEDQRQGGTSPHPVNRCSWKVSFGPSVQVKPWSLWGDLEGQEASVTPAAGPEDTAEGEDAQQVWGR